MNRKFLFWFRAGVHPVMIAFLRLLADMNQPALAGDDPFAQLEDHVDIATSSQLFSISMTSGTGSEAVAV